MGVHSIPPWTLKLRNLSLLGPDRMDNLLKAHTESTRRRGKRRGIEGSKWGQPKLAGWR